MSSENLKLENMNYEQLLNYANLLEKTNEVLFNENIKYKQASLTDPLLTSLGNRKAFEIELSRAVSNTNRLIKIEDDIPEVQKYFSLIIMDLDGLKEINDNYGHQKGDEFLLNVEGTLEKTLKRETDRGFRWGGDEIGIILPGTQLDQGIRIANQIKLGILNHESYGTVKGTASLGIANYKGTSPNKEDLFFHADQALITAKERGKNQVVAYTPESLEKYMTLDIA